MNIQYGNWFYTTINGSCWIEQQSRCACPRCASIIQSQTILHQWLWSGTTTTSRRQKITFLLLIRDMSTRLRHTRQHVRVTVPGGQPTSSQSALPNVLSRKQKRHGVASKSILLNNLLLCLPSRLGDRSFSVAGPCLWNSLTVALHDRNISLAHFKRLLKILWFV